MGLRDSSKALFRDAAAEARKLKRLHSAYYETDPKTFRAVISKAHSRVLRLKPGPKADPRVVEAARERGRSVPWEQLYPKYIDFYARMSEFTKALAEEGLRKKVNTHLRRHPSLKRKSRHRNCALTSQVGTEPNNSDQ